jgi:hypothetical protein
MTTPFASIQSVWLSMRASPEFAQEGSGRAAAEVNRRGSATFPPSLDRFGEAMSS